MEAVGEAAADRVEAGGGEAKGQLARLEDPDMPAGALEILVAQSQVEVLAGRRRDRDGELRAGLRDAMELADRAAIVVDVLHDLRADDPVEGRVREG